MIKRHRNRTPSLSSRNSFSLIVSPLLTRLLSRLRGQRFHAFFSSNEATTISSLNRTDPCVGRELRSFLSDSTSDRCNFRSKYAFASRLVTDRHVLRKFLGRERFRTEVSRSRYTTLVPFSPLTSPLFIHHTIHIARGPGQCIVSRLIESRGKARSTESFRRARLQREIFISLRRDGCSSPARFSAIVEASSVPLSPFRPPRTFPVKIPDPERNTKKDSVNEPITVPISSSLDRQDGVAIVLLPSVRVRS